MEAFMFEKRINRIIFTLGVLVSVSFPWADLKTFASDESVAETRKIGANVDIKLDSKSSALAPYLLHLMKTIKGNWFPPKGYESKRAIVFFEIEQSGIIKNLKLKRSTGNASADVAAIEAVKKSQPFGRLPKGSPKILPIEFEFDYNVFENGKILGLEKKSLLK